MKPVLSAQPTVEAAPGSGAATVVWRGSSGRHYEMQQEPLADFAFREDRLYAIVKDDEALWVGRAGELIADQESRDKFRAALRIGAAVLHIAAPRDAIDYMKLRWDIEGGGRAGALALAG